MPSSVHPCDWSNSDCIPDNDAFDMECYPGNLHDRYVNYLAAADDGKGGDVTNNGRPLKTFEEWLES